MTAGVVLLHGISRTARSMRAIERRLVREGYRTASLSYPSRSLGLSGLADGLVPTVAALAAEVDGPLHFVTHSMGGLVARVLLARYRPPRLGRVVMLAPPNRGSEIADRLSSWVPYRWWFGPAGQELVTGRHGVPPELTAAVDYEVGVIAGTRSIYPLASLMLTRPDDGRVSVAATRLEGMADHVALPTSHPMIVRDRAAIDQVVHFLAQGRFAGARDGPPAHGALRA